MLLQRSFRFLKYIRKTSYRKCRCYSERASSSITEKIKNGPGLKEFIAGNAEPILTERPHIPYLPDNIELTGKRKIYFDVYGCQMNLNDTEIVWSILKKEGFQKTEVEEEADIFLVMTCAIREGAENKIWHRLDHLRGYKRRAQVKNRAVKIGILGCMAERLKEKLIEKEKAVDVVAGPDSYRDLPRLLALTENGQTAVNVLLSLDETYADVVPVRLNQDTVTAFISIMRGCDNMCTYCIVPFTRGRERSRAAAAVCREAAALAERGVKDLTLLGQNVNSYRDTSEAGTSYGTAAGFSTVYKAKRGGLRFADLLSRVADVNPEMRIRFTAAHPKDFPDEVLQVIASRANICKQLHVPAQSGHSGVLSRMRRGYTREAYLDLITKIRDAIPGVGLSTDMICGFCGETDAEFEDTLSLMEEVRYNIAFLFPYSMREKTTAYRRYTDDVPDNIKKERHRRMIEVYRRHSDRLNALEVGTTHLVLAEGPHKTGPKGPAAGTKGVAAGPTELAVGPKKLTAGPIELAVSPKVLAEGPIDSDVGPMELAEGPKNSDGTRNMGPKTGLMCGRNEIYIKVVFDSMLDGSEIKRGEYVAVKIVSAKSSVLTGVPLYRTTLTEFYRERGWGDRMKYKQL